MKRKTTTKLLKWNMYSTEKKEQILDEFWRDYFTKYPLDGSMDELNVMRRQFQQTELIPRPS